MMTFLNPWAWFGLVAVAAPIIAHLLARRPARRQLFPTLRFVPSSALKPVRRDRLSDLMLLLLRCAIVVMAVAALAQPVWRWRSGERTPAQLARAIIVDTSASMSRRSPGGGSAVDEARRAAASIGNQAAIARTVETSAPSATIDAALNWLSAQPARRELVVISDFQPVAFSKADVDRIPADVGVQLIQVPVAEQNVGRGFSLGDLANLELLAGRDEQTGAAAARAAAAAAGARTDQMTHPVAIVFPGYERRAELLKSAAPTGEPWMFDVLRGVVSDAAVRVAFEELGQRPADGITAVQRIVNGRPQLLLVTTAPSHRVASAALIAAVSRLCSSALSPEEADPSVRSADEVRGWNRDSSATPPQTPADRPSQGRYLWMAVIALLLVEQWVRRRQRAASEAEVTRAA